MCSLRRDVKVMRQRAASGDEWERYLKRYTLNNLGANLSREMLRNEFIGGGIRPGKESATRRKPSDTYNEDGTPKGAAARALPPYPRDSAGGVGVKSAETDGGRSEPALLNLSNFLGSQGDTGGGSRKRSRGASERQFTEGIRGRYPEARLYAQLQELERKVDSISTRKRMQVEEALKHPGTCTRTLQIIMWNTHENQVPADTAATQPNSDGQAKTSAKPSWTLFITGRLVDANGEEVTGEGQTTLAALLERVFIQLPAHLYPDSHAIEWTCWDVAPKGNGLDAPQQANGATAGRGEARAFSGLSVKREGAEECAVRVMLQCTSNPKRFSLSGNPELGDLLGFESGTWSQLLVAFWAYVQDHDLHSDDDVRFSHTTLRAYESAKLQNSPPPHYPPHPHFPYNQPKRLAPAVEISLKPPKSSPGPFRGPRGSFP